jgi:hypothetical protein
MASLDLVVSVDTSVAHLAGALNRPVAILLKRLGTHWAWLYGRQDSVFYPSARLYRQHTPGDWEAPMARIARHVQDGAKLQAAGPGRMPLVSVSVGDLFDKLSILAIKRERIADVAKRGNVEREHRALAAVAETLKLTDVPIGPLCARLQTVNATLWTIEAEIRDCERRGDFGPRFIALARAVYTNNDERARLKSEINRLTGSALTEEKSYDPP